MFVAALLSLFRLHSVSNPKQRDKGALEPDPVSSLKSVTDKYELEALMLIYTFTSRHCKLSYDHSVAVDTLIVFSHDSHSIEKLDE
jgi:hypothetical protein